MWMILFIFFLDMNFANISLVFSSSSVINDAMVSGPKTFDPSKAHIEPKIQLNPITVEMDEDDGTRISLTIVDTPGFGDNIDNETCFEEILKYLELQYDGILGQESRIKRNPRFKDNRVHVLLYFIDASGHGLREIDIELMRRLSKRVNVILVLGRSDSLTPKELALAKKLTMEDIEHYNIPIYNFPYDVEEDDTETIEENSSLKAMLPFALVSATNFIQAKDGQMIRARKYPWGVVDIENPEYSDFAALRAAILGSHMADLKDLTHDFLYETYRTEKLSQNISDPRESALLNPEDLANQSFILKEEQLQREEEKLREVELRVQREIDEKRQELMAREHELREIEARISREKSVSAAAEEHEQLQRQIEQQNLEIKLKQQSLLQQQQQHQDAAAAVAAAANGGANGATNGAASNGAMNGNSPNLSKPNVPLPPGVSQEAYDQILLHHPSAVHDYEAKIASQSPQDQYSPSSMASPTFQVGPQFNGPDPSQHGQKKAEHPFSSIAGH